MRKDDEDIEPRIDPNSPKDQAFVWLSRLATGEADAAMLAGFERWRDADPRNEKALGEARRLWLLIGGPLEAQYAPAMASQTLRRRTQRRRWRPWLASAAVLVLAAGLGGQWRHAWRYDQVTVTGEQRTVALGEGSTMWLNTASAADIGVDGDARRVRLARGEAYFDVAYDPLRPFVVEAGAGRVRVLGTAFGVRREGDDVVVTVQRGSVQVAGGDSPPVIVTPDQTARLHPGDRAKTVTSARADQVLAWRTGRLQFENRPIGDVLDELRRYDRRVVIVSYPDAGRSHVSSIIDLARIDEWYDTLGQSLPVEVTRFGPFIWIRQLPARMAVLRPAAG